MRMVAWWPVLLRNPTLLLNMLGRWPQLPVPNLFPSSCCNTSWVVWGLQRSSGTILGWRGPAELSRRGGLEQADVWRAGPDSDGSFENLFAVPPCSFLLTSERLCGSSSTTYPPHLHILLFVDKVSTIKCQPISRLLSEKFPAHTRSSWTLHIHDQAFKTCFFSWCHQSPFCIPSLQSQVFCVSSKTQTNHKHRLPLERLLFTSLISIHTWLRLLAGTSSDSICLLVNISCAYLPFYLFIHS